MSNNNNLKYAFCEDWFIYAADENGILHYILTECWPEWSDFPSDADKEENAVEKYMLPLALKKWHRLSFIKTDFNISSIH